MTEKCSSCEQMKKENTQSRKALMETNKNYIEVVNENLALRREVEGLNKLVNRLCDSLEGKDFHG